MNKSEARNDLMNCEEITDINKLNLADLMDCLNPDTAGYDELEAIADGEICGQCGESNELRLTEAGYFCKECIENEIDNKEDESITLRDESEIGNNDSYKFSNDYYRRLI